MKQKRLLVLVGAAALALLLAVILWPRPAAVTGENLLKNGNFETLDESGAPADWYEDAYVGTPAYSVFDVGEGMDGGTSAHVKNMAGNDARYAQIVSVEPDSLYLLHGFVKADAVGGMGANLSVEGAYVFSNCAYQTDGWEELTLYGRTGSGQTRLTVFARVGGYSGESTGEAWFDDLSLTRVSEVPQGYLAQDLYTPSGESDNASPDVSAESTGGALLLLPSFLYLLAALFVCARQARKAAPLNQDNAHKQSGWALFFLLAAAALALLARVLTALKLPGYDVDIGCFTAWANRMAQVGPANFYADGYFSDYPPGYMLVLWLCGLLGQAMGTGATSFLVKLPSVIADLLGALILMRFVRARLEKEEKSQSCALWTACAASLLYLFNPLTMLAGAGWGQSDSVMTLFLLLTVIWAMQDKWRFALPAYMLAVLMKPQALMFGPLGLLALIAHLFALRADKPALRALLLDALKGLGLLAGVFAATVVPFSISKGGLSWLFELYGNTMSSYAYASVNACNLYYLFGCNWEPAGNLVRKLIPCAMGALLLFPALALYLKRGVCKKTRALCLFIMILGAGVALLGAVLPLSFSTLSAVMIGVSLAVVFAAYLLGGNIRHLPLMGALLLILLFNMGGMMHERYLFPALILLLLAWALEKDARLLLLTAGLTLALMLNVGCVLSRNIRIGGSAGNLGAPYFGLVSDMAPFEYLSAALNVLLCGLSLYLALDLTRENAVPWLPRPVKRAQKDGAPEKYALQDEKGARAAARKMDKKDWFILLAVTAVYACAAFWHLGSTKAPQTHYVFSDPNEQVVYDLGQHYDDFRMLYYGGIHYYDSSFTVETSDDGEYWSDAYSCAMKEGTCFQWKYVQSFAQTDSRALSGRYVRLTADHIGLTLFETLFRSMEGDVLPIASVSDSLSADVSALYDEQDTLEGEPGWYNSMYFDEIYHARTAYEHLHGIRPYETTHPPLGKVVMSFCVALFGMTPFGWRFAGTLCGVLMLPGMYLLGKLLFKKRRYAVLPMALMALDCMHYTQTRLATIDSFVVLFIIWAVYFMLRWFFCDFYGQKLWKSLVPLGLSGLFMGLAVASKWTGCYAGVGLAVLFFFGVWRRARAAREAKKALDTPSYAQTPDPLITAAAQTGFKRLLITVASCLVFFVAVPAAIYYCSYIPYFAPSGGVTLERIVEAAQGMLRYHSTPGLGMDHAFYSPWYQWPLSIKPMYYAADAYEPAGYASSILAFGNPAVWWVGLIALLTVLYAFLRHQMYPALFAGYRADKCYPLAPKGERDVRPALLLICFAAQYLPWMLVPRGTYIYHYFPSVPFIILCATLVFEYIEDYLTASDEKVARAVGANEAVIALRKARVSRRMLIAVTCYIVLTAALFIAYFPYVSGLMVKTEWLRAMNWFGNLYF